MFILRYVSANLNGTKDWSVITNAVLPMRKSGGHRACALKTGDLYHIPSSEALSIIEEEGSERL